MNQACRPRSEIAESTAISDAEFRAACGLFPTGVTVVTRQMGDGRPHGMTVSSFTSVSLDPPLILVCIDKRAAFLCGLALGAPFGVNMLGEEQEDLAVAFSRLPEAERFSEVHWDPGWKEVPMIGGIVAGLACIVERVAEAGDHLIVVGLVQEVRRHGGRPLVWCGSSYHCLPRP